MLQAARPPRRFAARYDARIPHEFVAQIFPVSADDNIPLEWTLKAAPDVPAPSEWTATTGPYTVIAIEWKGPVALPRFGPALDWSIVSTRQQVQEDFGSE